MATGELAETGRTESFEFTGHRGPFFRLMLVNLVLTILTLGIYRFWAKTKVRKFIWSNVRFMGDPLEYTGNGSELFLGFLIVLAVLFPLGLIYETIGRLVPPEDTPLRITLEVAYYLVLFALIQIGFYRAWRYRMSRTAWRGIRLGLDGSTWTFLKLSAGWTVLTALTLGLAYPWMAIELWRYQITHTRIGQTAAEFRGSGRDLLLPWLSVMIPSLLAIGGVALAANLAGEHVSVVMRDVLMVNVQDTTVFSLLIVSLALFATVPISWLWFSIRLARYQISGMSLENASIISTMPFGRLLGFAIFAVVVFITPVSGIIGAIYFLGTAQISVAIIFFLALTTVFVVFPITWTMIYTFELIKQIFTTAIVENSEALERTIQSASQSQKTGEGLADALDIGGL